jgi:hypothetical protein
MPLDLHPGDLNSRQPGGQGFIITPSLCRCFRVLFFRHVLVQVLAHHGVLRNLDQDLPLVVARLISYGHLDPIAVLGLGRDMHEVDGDVVFCAYPYSSHPEYEGTSVPNQSNPQKSKSLAATMSPLGLPLSSNGGWLSGMHDPRVGRDCTRLLLV